METEAAAEPTNQDDSEKTISLSELTKPTGKTAKTTRAPRAEVSISALRDAIKASLNQDLAASNDDGDANEGSSTVRATRTRAKNSRRRGRR